jgi:DNA-binding CsgD family transcriptional regulator/transcriptional regulator with GAF, ATPase, and Fis domain
MPSPVVDEVRSAGLDGRVSALGARLRLLLGSRPNDGAARVLLDELGELPLSAVEASAQRLVDPVQASGLMHAVNALQCELHDAVLDTHARIFGRINDGLAALAATVSPAELVERAPVLLCKVCEFDRAMISRVHGSTWAPTAVHVAAGAGDEVNVRLAAAIRTLEIPLTSALIETEMLRRRISVLVDGTAAARCTVSVLAALSRSRAYVAAPIVIADHVAGFLHADAYSSARMLTDADRVALQTFADLFGLVYERAAMAERLLQQQQAIRAALSSAASRVAELGPRVGQLVRAEVDATEDCPHPRRTGELREAGTLTSREWEILGLLATGANNGQIAAALFVSESTVKSHVKRILHKLPAANRAEAVFRYTQLSSDRSRLP